MTILSEHGTLVPMKRAMIFGTEVNYEFEI